MAIIVRGAMMGYCLVSLLRLGKFDGRVIGDKSLLMRLFAEQLNSQESEIPQPFSSFLFRVKWISHGS